MTTASAQPRERGSVTAETALAIPVVVILLAVITGVAQVGLARIACVDAARAGARQALRGDLAQAITEARSIAPSAAVAIPEHGKTVRVTVSSTVRLPLPGRPQFDIDCSAGGINETAFAD